MSKKAFTLAETMITIGIIGVVAALVIPQLIQKTNEKDLVSSYLKVHNVLTNAYKEAEAVEGYKLYKLEPDKFKELLAEHLKLTGENTCNNDMCLVDGAVVDYECTETQCNYLIVDTNGDKKPNQIGKDRYKFKVTEQGLISEGEQEICSGYDCGNFVLSHHKIFDGLLTGCETYGDDGRCMACSDGYSINNGLCNAVNMAGCKTYSGESCSQCGDGYSNNDGNCEKVNLPNCLSYTGDKCSSCENTHYVNGEGTCSTLPSNCLTADTSGTCTNCGTSYSINTSGTCTASVENCIEYNTQTCTIKRFGDLDAYLVGDKYLSDVGNGSSYGGYGTVSYNGQPDYWAGAQRKCSQNSMEMPTLSQLQTLANSNSIPVDGLYWVKNQGSLDRDAYAVNISNGKITTVYNNASKYADSIKGICIAD